MVRLGKTYSNLMVEVSATNSKLRTRKMRILLEASGAGEAVCAAVLAEADGNLRLALVMLLGGVDARAARQALAAAVGGVRRALDLLLRFSKDQLRNVKSVRAIVRSLHDGSATGVAAAHHKFA
jgi:N-acetylmuramic acid 6-phosphate (MurNAc-6-P) etherase